MMSNHTFTQYEDLVRTVLNKGVHVHDRTGTGTLSLFSQQLRFDMVKGFPIVTTKRVSFPDVLKELLWFISGQTNVKPLHESGCSIWNEWAGADGELGPIYGHQWRNWGGKHDQLQALIDGLIDNPYSRRHIVSAWNVSDIPDMALPPCHMMFQCYVADGRLSMAVTQRSCDVMLGLPYNLASYGALLHMISQQTGYPVGELVWNGGDVHIYVNHIDGARAQLEQEQHPAPTLHLWSRPSIDDYKVSDFHLVDYKHGPKQTYKVAV